MRLTKIKLAGFKSFVDPTTIYFPASLSAVVGPNGCGKSNVIDAVRWVMGESSAKHLRGGASTDVIFSGSATRKPVGQAAVELLFDNQDGRLGGAYAGYSEIGIRRVVTRDGQSQYFLNGTRCRRRDIKDVFLGTGLGPRSYAIIEQGMISRVIDAKPEDLRVYVEETAGISKYKERRRETETRIRHTRENLDRLNDLRDELDKQLHHLERQSQAAEKYKTFKAEEAALSEQLAALNWQEYNEQLEDKDNDIRVKTNELESKHSDVTNLTKALESDRVHQVELQEKFNTVQKQFYLVGGEISRLEQTLQHHKDRALQLKTDLGEAQTVLTRAEQHLETDTEQCTQIQAELAEYEPQHQAAIAEYEQCQAGLQQAEQSLEAWRSQADSIRQNAQTPVRTAEVEKANITHLEEKIRQGYDKKEKLEYELANLTPKDQTNISVLEDKVAGLQKDLEALDVNVTDVRAKKEEHYASIRQLKQALDTDKNLLQQHRGRQASLEALQQAALGKQQDAVNVWLSEHQLGDNPRLAESLQVTPKWANAVETVLNDALEAVVLSEDKASQVLSTLSELPSGHLGVIYPSVQTEGAAEGFDEASAGFTATTLLSCIENQQELVEKGLWPTLVNLLRGIYVAGTYTEAQDLLTKLPAQSSVITVDGIWLSHGWVRLAKETKDPHSGILAREQALKELLASVDTLSEKIEKEQVHLSELESLLKDCETENDTLLKTQRQTERDCHIAQSDLKVQMNRLAQQKARLVQVETELTEIQGNTEIWQEQIKTKRGALQNALEEMAALETQRVDHDKEKSTLELGVRAAREALRAQKENEHQLALKCQTAVTQLTALESNIGRSQNEMVALKERILQIGKHQADNDAPMKDLSFELEGHLHDHANVEKSLQAARDSVHEADERLQQNEKQKQALTEESESLREALEQIRLDSQTVRVYRQNALDKLSESGKLPEQILENLPPEATSLLWTEALEKNARRIQRLGAINLVAIEEFSAAKERKTYLDKQNEDLLEALGILESAISKIDRETKARFKDTFNQINENFKALFPKLFGGGQAYLSLTGEDLLDTGVGIVARPPGKRNSTIQQLSGGEKALTAVALVFAFFQLNPAPFCMLDEVDAPLDDSNVGRFCNLVKHLAETVQFIYISHNKLAIEMAEQLQGVTMREPGVSRIVSVDVNEASALAASEGELESGN